MKPTFPINDVQSKALFRLEIRTAKNPKNITFQKFYLPDGQRVHVGTNPLRREPKYRIGYDGAWDYCRDNIKAKLKEAVKKEDEPRQRFLVKCLNIVQDDNNACNFLNGFNNEDEFKSKKISFETFKEKYLERFKE